MSKPQLVMMEVGGAHNEDVAGGAARILSDGSWKQQRIVVIIPSAASIPAKVALSHWNLMFPPNNGVQRILTLNMEVGQAYSIAVEQILAHEQLSTWEYILTVEHDNMPPWNGVVELCKKMEAHPEYACIGGLYWTKGHGGVPQIWGDPRDPTVNFRPQPPVPGQLVECCGTGMGFNLWRISMFKDSRLRRPWFKTQTEGGAATQDLYFWSDARKYGYRCAVDCAVKVGHYDLTGAFGIADKIW